MFQNVFWNSWHSTPTFAKEHVLRRKVRPWIVKEGKLETAGVGLVASWVFSFGQSAQWAPVSPFICQGGTARRNILRNLSVISVMKCCGRNIGTVSPWVLLGLCPHSNFVGRWQWRRSCCGCAMKATSFQEVRTIFVSMLVFVSSDVWSWAFNDPDSFNFMHGQLAANDQNADKERTASKSSI